MKKTLQSKKQRTAASAHRQSAGEVLAALKKLASKSVRLGMARYGLPMENALGVPVGKIQKLAKQLGRNHELALALWDTGCYEARMLACYVDEPERVTPSQMDRWCRDFDNWGIVDTVCFVLFDRTPHAFSMIHKWAGRRGEFEKRAAFALLACVALHDKAADDDQFTHCFPLVEKGAADHRNFVKKGIVWAMRGIASRNPDLCVETMALAQRLAASGDPASLWVGKTVLKELTSPASKRRLEKQKRGARSGGWDRARAGQ